ncbi:hypothetical protein I4F81_007185 [Pyropia yezoensis]|uniref:Uncharacterized protein n=1 Tax=Pyropia yezoensis TaxID=2788 RepID=A0ACC3C3V7_PYRYE|nr:hypothetical protein I4F81_007185 [Neopyropia yezoensis]
MTMAAAAAAAAEAWHLPQPDEFAEFFGDFFGDILFGGGGGRTAAAGLPYTFEDLSELAERVGGGGGGASEAQIAELPTRVVGLPTTAPATAPAAEGGAARGTVPPSAPRPPPAAAASAAPAAASTLRAAARNLRSCRSSRREEAAAASAAAAAEVRPRGGGASAPAAPVCRPTPSLPLQYPTVSRAPSPFFSSVPPRAAAQEARPWDPLLDSLSGLPNECRRPLPIVSLFCLAAWALSQLEQQLCHRRHHRGSPPHGADLPLAAVSALLAANAGGGAACAADAPTAGRGGPPVPRGTPGGARRLPRAGDGTRRYGRPSRCARARRVWRGDGRPAGDGARPRWATGRSLQKERTTLFI